MKPLPMSQGRVVAKGSQEKMLMAVDSAGNAQTISSSEYREFFVPAGGDFNGALVLVQIGTLSGYDPESNHIPFFWSDKNPDSDPTAVVGNFDWYGKSSEIAKKAGFSMGFFKASTAGSKVVIWCRE